MKSFLMGDFFDLFLPLMHIMLMCFSLLGRNCKMTTIPLVAITEKLVRRPGKIVVKC